jgi:hypothetical protein
MFLRLSAAKRQVAERFTFGAGVAYINNSSLSDGGRNP